ncbi:MAG TPA: helix-turn-helix domain-containing protein [Streptosporangiaceae bacterium]
MRIRRCAAGLTQEELAERSGLSVRTIRNIERGRTVTPTRTSVRLIAAALSGPSTEPIAWETPAEIPAPESAFRAGTAWAVNLLAGAAGPAQLPPGPGDLCGRAREVGRLTDRLVRAHIGAGSGAGPAATVVVVGMAGVGKSAVALTTADRVRTAFPDGQLYVNLRGTAAPAPPPEVLSRILRDLGTPVGEVPSDADERAGRYQSLLTGRRVLLVLDDARDAGQVRPLIPNSPGCGVIVTSRYQLADVEGCRPLTLGPLPAAAARELLATIVGPDRLAREPVATELLLNACGGIPLALKIVALRLSSRPAWSVQRLAHRLACPDRRIAELSIGELGVAAALRQSYDNLLAFDDGGAARAAFGVLGRIGPVRFSADTAAVLTGHTREHMERILELLVDTHLIEAPAPDQYQFHELVSLFAKQLGAAQRPAS